MMANMPGSARKVVVVLVALAALGCVVMFVSDMRRDDYVIKVNNGFVVGQEESAQSRDVKGTTDQGLDASTPAGALEAAGLGRAQAGAFGTGEEAFPSEGKTPADTVAVVHITGAVKNPGVYEVPGGSRVNDVVMAAGGLASDAAPEYVNLALLVYDSQQIYIPHRAEVKGTEPPAKQAAIGKTSIQLASRGEPPTALRPMYAGAVGQTAGSSAKSFQPVAGVKQALPSTAAGSSAGGFGVVFPGQAWTSGAAPGGQGRSNGKININTASPAELEELPGIGPATAQKIVEWRETYGPFITIEDIMQVSGIGEKRFAAIRDLITVE